MRFHDEECGLRKRGPRERRRPEQKWQQQEGEGGNWSFPSSHANIKPRASDTLLHARPGRLVGSAQNQSKGGVQIVRYETPQGQSGECARLNVHPSTPHATLTSKFSAKDLSLRMYKVLAGVLCIQLWHCTCFGLQHDVSFDPLRHFGLQAEWLGFGAPSS